MPKATKPKPAPKAGGKPPRKLAPPKGGEHPITNMQKKFCEYLAQGQNHTEAMKNAGSKAKNPEVIAHRWLRLAKVLTYLQSLPAHQQEESERRSRIADAAERQEILTSIIRGEDRATFVVGFDTTRDTPTHADKLRAADMLAKMNGEYTLNINMKVTQYAQEWLEDLFTLLEEYLPSEKVDELAARLKRFNP